MSEERKTVNCKVCKTENSIFRMRCSDCNQYLGKPPRKSNPRSKQSKGRDKYKRPPLRCNKNKECYSLGDVKAAQKRVFKNRGASMRYYYCKECKAYHLTKSRS